MKISVFKYNKNDSDSRKPTYYDVNDIFPSGEDIQCSILKFIRHIDYGNQMNEKQKNTPEIFTLSRQAGSGAITIVNNLIDEMKLKYQDENSVCILAPSAIAACSFNINTIDECAINPYSIHKTLRELKKKNKHLKLVIINVQNMFDTEFDHFGELCDNIPILLLLNDNSQIRNIYSYSHLDKKRNFCSQKLSL
jgi:hypothetical protein